MRKLVLLIVVVLGTVLASCKAKAPDNLESEIAIAMKKMNIGGKDWKNPTPDNEASIKAGAEHFQHHCQICHGLDGHNTGVPFAAKMSPPVLDLGEKDVQDFTDGQLKWIIENGIRFTGMPGWKGVLEDDEMWYMVRFMRHLPAKGSLGAPAVYQEAEEEHEATEKETGGHTHQHHHHEHGEHEHQH
jgi:mono/diheme cytochrome c family protein